MNFIRRVRHSPATLVAAGALTLALAGTALAGPDATKRAPTKAKVVKLAKKQANAVVSKREPALNVNSANSADTAAVADAATTADTAKAADEARAVNGVSMHEIAFSAPTGTDRTVVFQGNGLILQAECEDGVEVGVRATSQNDGSTILYSLVDTDFDADSPIANDVENRGFDTNESVRLDDDASDSSVITFTYFGVNGSTVSGTIGTDEVQAAGQPAVCDVRGHIQAS